MPASADAIDGLYFVVNPSSGGQRGYCLMKQLEALAPDRVCDLLTEDPQTCIERAAHSGGRLVVCGGDGTVASVLDLAYQFEGEAMPPVGVVPLGTGNDLACHLGWNPCDGGISRDEVLAFTSAAVREIDRWELTGPRGFTATWYNYCSFGLDARIAGRFHALREQNPWLFRHRLSNKFIYTLMGLGEQGAPLPLEIDGHNGALPEWGRTLVLLNIPSYAGGGNLGRNVAEADGRCDLFLLGAGLLMGLGISGLRRPLRLAPMDRCVIRLRRSMHLQYDGEPCLAMPGRYQLRRAGRVRVLAAAPIAADCQVPAAASSS
ncbi:MAG: diacylglycerol kinase family protein [Planctomycetota bacterium]